MKKIILLSTMLSAAFLIKAQSIQFEQVDPSALAPFNTTGFSGVQSSSIAFEDVNGDSHLDVLVTGYNGNRIAELYTNDGTGMYTLVPGTPFTGVFNSSVAFVDIAGDQHVLITGRDGNGLVIAELYVNDGAGNFTLVSGTTISGVANSSIAFADIDSDGDQDLLITGTNGSGNYITELYKYDDINGFVLQSSSTFTGVSGGSVAFADIRGNGVQDILITGLNSSFNPTTELYENDGTGVFTLVSGTPFTAVQYSSIAFADIDGDGDLDVFITGQSGANKVANLYKNDGAGSFTLATGSTLTGVSNSSVAFADVTGNNHLDLLITGENSSNNPIAELYENDGTGIYTLVSGTPFTGVSASSVAFVDIDSDGDQDLFITGGIDGSTHIAKLYRNVTCDLNIGVTQNGETLTSDATGVTYQWLDCNDGYLPIAGETSQVFVAPGNGSYAVEITDNSCIDTSACVTVTTVGIEDFTESSNKLYPNPVSNELTIESQGDISKIEVYSVAGQLLQTSTPLSTETKINFSSYEKGVYLIKLHTTDGQVTTSRVVKD